MSDLLAIFLGDPKAAWLEARKPLAPLCPQAGFGASFLEDLCVPGCWPYAEAKVATKPGGTEL